MSEKDLIEKIRLEALIIDLCCIPSEKIDTNICSPNNVFLNGLYDVLRVLSDSGYIRLSKNSFVEFFNLIKLENLIIYGVFVDLNGNIVCLPKGDKFQQEIFKFISRSDGLILYCQNIPSDMSCRYDKRFVRKPENINTTVWVKFLKKYNIETFDNSYDQKRLSWHNKQMQEILRVFSFDYLQNYSDIDLLNDYLKYSQCLDNSIDIKSSAGRILGKKFCKYLEKISDNDFVLSCLLKSKLSDEIISRYFKWRNYDDEDLIKMIHQDLYENDRDKVMRII